MEDDWVRMRREKEVLNDKKKILLDGEVLIKYFMSRDTFSCAFRLRRATIINS